MKIRRAGWDEKEAAQKLNGAKLQEAPPAPVSEDRQVAEAAHQTKIAEMINEKSYAGAAALEADMEVVVRNGTRRRPR